VKKDDVQSHTCSPACVREKRKKRRMINGRASFDPIQEGEWSDSAAGSWVPLWCRDFPCLPAALAWVSMTREMNPPTSSPRACIEGSSLSLTHIH
jgi:hypothetical protein